MPVQKHLVYLICKQTAVFVKKNIHIYIYIYIYMNDEVVVMEFRHLKNISGCEQNIPKVLHDRLTITALDVFGYSHHAFPFLLMCG